MGMCSCVTVWFSLVYKTLNCCHFSTKKMSPFAPALFLINILLAPARPQDQPPGNMTDFARCKMSHLGLEYLGDVALTEGGVRCQSWSAGAKAVHKVGEEYTDAKFPDGSRKAAKSYCRNPSRNEKGPWCYTMDIDLIDDSCGLPLCSLTECKLSGPGMEYGGTHNKGVSDRKCLKWDKDRSKIKTGGNHTSQSKYPDHLFPDGFRKDAKKYCRNPSGDPGGPWCFVEIEDSDAVEREYCDIPFCDDQDCMVLTKNTTIYSHFTSFDRTLSNLTFGVKLWDSDSYLEAHARLVLSVMALPISGDQMNDLGVGIELYISNRKSGLTFGLKDEVEFEGVHNVLKSTEYTFFSLNWDSGFITLNKVGQTKPIFLQEYKIKDNLLGYLKNEFKYYSALGTNILWTFPFCDDDFDCDVHTTVNGFFQQFWPLRQTQTGNDLSFHVRGFRSANLLLVASPGIDYPRVKVSFISLENKTRVLLEEYPRSPLTILQELQLPNVIDYWQWREFSIALFANTFSLYWIKDLTNHVIFELKHEVFRSMRWFSPSSDDTPVMWTFFCEPPKFAQPPQAWLPECALNKDEPDYKGTQDVASEEALPCLPWAGRKLLPDNVRDHFPNRSVFAAWNYCRDPTGDRKGTYCYTISRNRKQLVEKNYCSLRKCKSAECRMAGTGNDYIGKVNVTRSNRTCQRWFIPPPPPPTNATILNNTDVNNTQIDVNLTITARDLGAFHEVDPEFLNGSLYADMSAEVAWNFCRNPSRTIAGSWCYTQDETVEKDICNIRDCDMREECITIIKGNHEGRNVYILPQWKEKGMHGGLHFALKEWNPDYLEGLIITIKPMHGTSTLKLTIGADINEKITLMRNAEMVKEKTLPHLIPSGKWAAFWLQIRQGELLLGFEGVPTALFEWKHVNMRESFKPMFVSFTTINAYPIGVFFKCDECHTENTTVNNRDNVMPIGLWSENEIVHKNFSLKLRGSGVAIISLYLLPESDDFYIIALRRRITLMRRQNGDTPTLKTVKASKSLLTNNSWTEFMIAFTEEQIRIIKNGTTIFRYNSSTPLLFYWFTIGAERGWITWSANCEPLDIDGPPRDGGWSQWSPWQCTVSCGGGEGFRTRTCSNPHPNIFGEMCDGPATSTGLCNDFLCGDVSPETLDAVREHLQRRAISLRVSEGGAVSLENDAALLKRIARESPDAFYEWTVNGVFLRYEEGRVGFRGDGVFIERAHEDDGGVYVCMVHRINKQRLVIRVIALVVVTKDYGVSTRATLPLTVTSNAVTLGYIYSDLSQKWLVNNKTYVDYGITTLAAVSTEKVDSLNSSHDGVWECVVRQEDLNLEWVTRYVKVRVKSKPTFFTHLMEDELTAPIFGWLKSERNVLVALVFIVVGVVAIVAAVLVLYLKFGTLKTFRTRNAYKRNRRK